MNLVISSCPGSLTTLFITSFLFAKFHNSKTYIFDRLTGLSSIHDWGIRVPKQGRCGSKSSAGLPSLLCTFDIVVHAVRCIHVSIVSLLPFIIS